MNIIITFKNTINDFIDCIYYFEKFSKPSKKFYFSYIFLPIFGIGVSIVDILINKYFSIFNLITIIFFLLIFIFSSTIYNYNLYKKAKELVTDYNDINKIIDNKKHIILYDNYILFNILNKDNSEKKIYFKDIFEVIIDNTRIFIYTIENLSISIPISNFENCDEKDIFLKNLSNISNCKIINNRTRYFN
ncbi:hypothetical protein ACFO6R_10910 [Eubacterium multiforme]|uniref:YcxB-like protein n=1 Tax=Eubacterium multiforme TaxID=83339 RepID=A0ABT9UVF0_9FIRM|nr:hypothetical protein [Eubacterium multiforme]MDQ0150305.1 hypothetical protein [Eubacterium multiforme]